MCNRGLALPYIENAAFYDCSKVKSITCACKNPPAFEVMWGEDGAFGGISKTHCTLYVPEVSVDKYKETAGWNEFANIVGVEMGNPDATEACDAPTISFDNETKKLNFSSATSDATYIYSISSEDMANYQATEGNVPLTGVYNITAYTTADGKQKNETVTAKLLWVNATIEDVPTDIVSAGTQRGVIISTNSGKIRISGTTDGEPVEVYSTDGALIQSVAAENGQTIMSGLPAGAVYVVRIGGASAKVTL